MKKAYIVTDGCYSDYSIEAVFSTKELADKYVREICGSEARAEEWNLDEYEEKIRQGYFLYYVRMNKQGDVLDVTKEHSTRQIENQPHFNANGHLWMEVMAKTEQHAIKIVNERRVQIIAANQWKYDFKDEEVTDATPKPC